MGWRQGSTKIVNAYPTTTGHWMLSKNVTRFLQNYAEKNAILLPGRIPGYKRDDIKILPSSQSKKVPMF